MGAPAEALTPELLNQVERWIKQGLLQNDAQAALVMQLMAQGRTLEPWSQTKTITGFGATANADVITTFSMENDDIILTHADFAHYYTDNTTSTHIPTFFPLPLGGRPVLDSSDNLIAGLVFKGKWKSHKGAIHELNDGFWYSSHLKGDTCNRYVFEAPFLHQGDDLVLTTQTLQAKGGSDVVVCEVVLNGIRAWDCPK